MTRKMKSFFSNRNTSPSTSSSSSAAGGGTPLLPHFYDSNPPPLVYSDSNGGTTHLHRNNPTPRSTNIQSRGATSKMSSHRSSSPSNSNSSSNPSFHSTPSYDVISRGDNGFESSSGTSNSDLEGGENDGRTTWLMAAFLLVNAALGAGLLNYPVAYDRLGGIAFASVIQAFAVFLMATTMLVLVYCARVHNESSYHGVMRTMCGKRVMQAAAASIAITCFGICVTFLIIIGDQFDRLLATY